MIHQCKNKIMQSCSYIIWKEQDNNCYIIDCGDFSEIHSFLNIHSLQPKGLFLTHCHFDHIYGLNEFISTYPDCCIYGSKETLDGLYDEKINLSFYQGNPYIVSQDTSAKIVCISSSSEIILFDKPLRIMDTPGHDTGCLSYQYDDCLFTGDSYIPFVPVFTKWKRSNKEIGLYNESKLKRFGTLYKLKIYPGHYDKY